MTTKTKLGLTGLLLIGASLFSGCKTVETNKVVEQPQPVKPLAQITTEYNQDMENIRENAIKENEKYEAEFIELLKEKRKGNDEKYDRLMELYDKLGNKIKERYQADIAKINKEREDLYEKELKRLEGDKKKLRGYGDSQKEK